jgi:transcriptional regulator with XRE-family HTH domain
MAGQDVKGQAAGVAGDASGEGLALHVRCREKRRALGISQQELADKVGVRQSAVSTFERRGNEARVLSAENVRLLADVLGLVVGEGDVVVRQAGVRLALFFCPDSECPSTLAYRVGERTAYRPRFVRAEAGERLFCPDCGEVCEVRCPGCRAPVSERLRGAFCPECGSPFLSGEDLGEEEIAGRERSRGTLAGNETVAEYRHVRERLSGNG